MELGLIRGVGDKRREGEREWGIRVMGIRMMEDKEVIQVNKILGKQAGFGPVQSNQVLPWFAIIMISYFIFDGLLGWGIPKVALISFWLILSWWLVTGKDPDKYINRFRKPKGKNWVIGGALYISPLLSGTIRKKLKKEKRY